MRGAAIVLRELHERIVEVAPELAVFLVYDRPLQVETRPGIDAYPIRAAVCFRGSTKPDD